MTKDMQTVHAISIGNTMAHQWITLEEWAEETFSQPPAIRTLRAWARAGKIQPVQIVGRSYMCPPHAKYNPNGSTQCRAESIKDDVVIGILSNASA